MIIDIHCHFFMDNLAKKALTKVSGLSNISSHTDGTLKNIMTSMKNSDIDICVLQPIATRPNQTKKINQWAVDIQNKNIISFGTIHPEFTDWKNELLWLKEKGIKGIKLHPDYQDFFVDDDKLFPIYETIFKLGFILMFHAGIDIGIPTPCHCTPVRLKNILDTYPDGKIIAAHMGGYQYWEDVKKYLVGKNIYFDTSYSYDDLGCIEMTDIIKKHGVKKILFGTDTPWKSQKKEVLNIKSLNLSSQDIDNILGNNAQTLLNL